MSILATQPPAVIARKRRARQRAMQPTPAPSKPYEIAREHLRWAVGRGFGTSDIAQSVGCGIPNLTLEHLIELLAIKWQGLHMPFETSEAA